MLDSNKVCKISAMCLPARPSPRGPCKIKHRQRTFLYSRYDALNYFPHIIKTH